MKKMMTMMLALALVMSLPAFAAVQCTVPGAEASATITFDVQELPGTLVGGGETPAYDPKEGVAPDDPTQGLPLMTEDGKYTTMGALFTAWGGYEGYPDYVGGVWTETGDMSRLTVAVTDEAGEEAIRAQLDDQDSVEFVLCKYSYEELNAVMEELAAQMWGGGPISACGVYERENAVHVTLKKDYENVDLLAKELANTYGDKVVVEMGDGIITMTNDVITIGPIVDGGTTEVLTAVPKRQNLLPLMLLLAALALCGGFLAKKLPARVTNAGTVVTGGKLTRTQTEAAVRAGEETPPDRVEEQIRKQL